MIQLDPLVPAHLRQTARQSGNEWVYPYPSVLQVIEIASSKSISVLGVELFQILENGLITEGLSGYEVQFVDDWIAFVQRNNALALDFVEQNRRGLGYGYILTSTSADEFRSLKVAGPSL